jgi:hypothetical protein
MQIVGEVGVSGGLENVFNGRRTRRPDAQPGGPDASGALWATSGGWLAEAERRTPWWRVRRAPDADQKVSGQRAARALGAPDASDARRRTRAADA